jgi:hypothetical protein
MSARNIVGLRYSPRLTPNPTIVPKVTTEIPQAAQFKTGKNNSMQEKIEKEVVERLLVGADF